MKLGIVGHGFVGSAVNQGFTKNINKYIVDPKYYSSNTIESLIEFKPNATFVAVPTPQLETGECNTDILQEVLQKTKYAYLNNTVAYAIAYAIAEKVSELHLYGIDFTHKAVNFAEAGRGCCEFWLAIAVTKGIKINIAHNSSLLDTSVPDDQKLYGYHRLEDPIVSTTTQGSMLITRKSKLDPPEPLDATPNIVGREDILGVTYEEVNKNV